MADQDPHIYKIYLKPRNGAAQQPVEIKADSIEGGDDFVGFKSDYLTLKLGGNIVGKIAQHEMTGWSKVKAE